MRRRGFTLIELLIVVAIIAILAAIAVPNFLEAQVRSKISRCKADMRSLLLAAEAYRTDWGKYMPDNVLDKNGVKMPDMYSWVYLTTPVSFMTSIPQSPFKEWENRKHGYNGPSANDGDYFEYWAGGFQNGLFVYNADASATGIFWRSTSVGPDNLSDYEGAFPTGAGAFTPRAIQERWPKFVNTIYDPTNGTTSRGDFFICNKGFIM